MDGGRQVEQQFGQHNSGLGFKAPKNDRVGGESPQANWRPKGEAESWKQEGQAGGEADVHISGYGG